MELPNHEIHCPFLEHEFFENEASKEEFYKDTQYLQEIDQNIRLFQEVLSGLIDERNELRKKYGIYSQNTNNK